MNRKLEWKRLCIYLLLSFGMAWLIFIWYMATGHTWNGENQYLESLVGLGMLTPFMAHVLTRLLTGEGFSMIGKNSMMLGINWKNGKWKYYLAALFLPWLYFELAITILMIMFPSVIDVHYYKTFGISPVIIGAYPLICIVQGVIISFAALGEEGGWRGYMMPKLISLVGRKKAIVFGGIIWGLWHAPLTCIGHNFGTEYPGFPYVGILMMCVMCTAIGSILTYITVKTESVWPAAFMHAINNQNPGILKFIVNTESLEKSNSFMFLYFLQMIPMMILGIVCFFLLIRKDKNV